MIEKVILGQKKILDSLIQWETRISELYGICAQQSSNGSLWLELAKEERAHAAMLGSLRELLEKGHLFWNLGQFTDSMVAEQIAVVDADIQKARREVLSEGEIVQMALDIEKSLLEAGFYSMVTSDSKEFAFIAGALVKATEKHVQKLKKTILDHAGDQKWL